MLLSSSISLLISYLVVLSIVERGMLKSLTKIVNLIFFLSVLSVCFTYFLALLFGAYTCRIAISSWWIGHLLSYNVYLDFVCVCLILRSLIMMHLGVDFGGHGYLFA